MSVQYIPAMPLFRRIVCCLLGLAALALGVGCSVFTPKPDLSHGYTLNPMAKDASPAPPPDPTLSLAVYYTEIPTYLDRPQMVVRWSNNQPYLDEYHRWLEPLSAGFSRVLAQDIAQLADASHVAAYPLPPAFGQDFEVYVTVTQFDGSPSGDVTLRAAWRISGPGGKPNYYSQEKSFTRRVPPGSDLAAAYVDTLSALVGDLAREIVKALPEAESAKTTMSP